jgi:hypothetical protein
LWVCRLSGKSMKLKVSPQKWWLWCWDPDGIPHTNNTIRTCISAWLKYCGEQNISPTNASIPEAVQFLHHLHTTKKLGYSALNTARSALSAILQQQGTPFGKNLQVKHYLHGLFNESPPQPRYVSTWDPDTVLQMLKTWAPAHRIDFKRLTLKVVMLILFVSGQRLQTLSFYM